MEGRQERYIQSFGWGRPEEKKPLGRSHRRWENNIKMDLKKLDGVTYSGLIWFRIGTGGGRF
jgi:hypothetical protein